MDMLKYYTKFYSGIRKEAELKNIDDRMFFITDLDTVLDFIKEFENDMTDMSQEIMDHPERFMPKDNILITVLPPEKQRKMDPIVVSGHITYDGQFLTSGGGYLNYLDTDEASNKQLIVGIVTYIFVKLNTKATEVSIRDTPFRTNKGRDKIIPVVYFKNEKEKIKYQYYLPRDPEWKHSWECIGHWRKVTKIGKDRNGEYNQIGRTWVNPCVKGDGELVRKLRIV